MKINLKNLSRDELNELKKSVLAEIEARDSSYKSSFGAYDSLHALFSKDLLGFGVEENDLSSIISSMERAIYRLCDITLKNYKLKIRKDKNILAVNGAIVMNHQALYQKMSDDIVRVIYEYKKKLEESEASNE